ncbi:alpha/beta hydrolase [Dyella tabacisoli]|uniref:Alpha/beta hydrolase n=1 Tax=Dyella tabacisoli TaxID=2282381 RepID=A0A369UP60_9GAMM|nr:alpha/beta hydrolase [Dyella tabacisoli]
MLDTTTPGPSVVLVPDGPNTIEHYSTLIARLSPHRRVICFDMPGFGFSRPAANYGHSLDQGARAVLDVLDHLGIERTTLAFSCANGFYAMQAAQLAPSRIASLFLAQTPSLAAMHAWTDHVIPRPLHIPVLGQTIARAFRRKMVASWYRYALPESTDPKPFQQTAMHALSAGGCFCLAGVVQGLSREPITALAELSVPCTMLWGTRDRSHRHTAPESLLACAPRAEIIRVDDCGHFPDIEQPERYVELLLAHLRKYA